MPYKTSDFIGFGNITALIHRGGGKPAASMNSELSTLVTALGTDTTTHDRTIEAAPVALRPAETNTRFTNDMILIINEAKAGNMLPAQIATAIGSIIVPP